MKRMIFFYFIIISALTFIHDIIHAERYLFFPVTDEPTYYCQISKKGHTGITHWTTNNVVWYLNIDGAPGFTFNTTKTLIDPAFDAWENISTADISFSYLSSTDHSRGYDDMNVLTWVHNDDQLFDEGNPFDPDGLNASAITIFTCNTKHEILDVDIAFNGEKTWYNNGYAWNDIQSVATHEIGHMVGLGHTNITTSPYPVMIKGVSTPTPDRRNIKFDDEKGASFLCGGNLIDDEIFPHTLWFEWSVTIPSGINITFQDDITITVRNNSSITVNGTLCANGNSSSPITFDFISPNSTTQNGIIFNSGSSGTINYCQIRNAYRGIYENNTSVNITNSAISGCTDGIYLYYSSPVIEGCNVHDNSDDGINLVYSSPTIKENYIQNNFNGIFCSSGSNAVIGNNLSQEGNHINNNSYGIVVFNTANPVVGNSSSGGYNNMKIRIFT